MRYSQDTGRLAETVVFLEIKRRNDEVYYWKNQDGFKIDFVVKSGQKITELIQVSWNVRDEAVQMREERALWCAMEELEVDSGIISPILSFTQKSVKISFFETQSKNFKNHLSTGFTGSTG